jgi:hypothetical protein
MQAEEYGNVESLEYHIKLEFGTTAATATAAAATAVRADRVFAAGIIQLSLLWIPKDLVSLAGTTHVGVTI